MRYDDDPTHWKYRGEGNFHIIIAHKENKVVLRLPKRFKEADKRKSDLLLSETAAKNEILFQKHIIFPLLRNCRACFQSHLIKFTPNFLCEIEAIIKDERPSHRRHKEIDLTCLHGVLLPDFAHVLPRPPSSANGSCSICIEIKPKKGFLDSNGNCSYCSKQFLKLKKGSCAKRSSYCPLDLFSGDFRRMKTALMSLIENPQNNLRVFKNGELVFAEEICNSYRGSNLDLFTNAVLSLFSYSVDRKMAVLIESLCNILTHSLVDIPSVTYAEHTCCPMKMYKNEVYTQDKENKPIKSCLMNGCILDLILRIQKLEQCTLDEYYEMYNEVSENNLLNLLEQPFSGKTWQSLLDSITNQDESTEPNHDNDMLTNYVQLLQKFLIATSLKDCSILLTLQENNSADDPVSNKDAEAFPILLNSSKGASFWCSVAIIDCDPKPVNRIPTYAKLETEILNSFHSFMQSKG